MSGLKDKRFFTLPGKLAHTNAKAVIWAFIYKLDDFVSMIDSKAPPMAPIKEEPGSFKYDVFCNA